ncbi:hypothetical protein BC831DRAFT_470839 [Entophlyctis helioformis]|nr:hypothetical protein BC831DRAFT_470839 [Entophlyctis helioformis]
MLDINERLVAGSAIAPLHVAAARGFDAAVRLLLAVPGVVVDIRDAETETPLFKAALRGHAGTVQLLLAGGADAQACDAHGWTALHNAASQGHLDVVRLIADAGVSVNAASTAGFTPLMNAAARGQIRVAEFLLGAGADPTLANGSRDTAHDVALYHEHYHLARMLDQAEQQWCTCLGRCHQAHVDELHENQRGGSALFPAQLMAAVPGNFTFAAASLVSGSDPSPLTNSLGLASGFRHVPLPGVVDPATGRSVPQWFWLTEWRLDTTDPRLADAGGGVRDVGDDQDGGSARSEGWLYAKSFDMPADAWRSTLVANDTPAASSTVTGFVSSLFGGPAASASASGSGWVRRRRWVRVRKRRADYDRIAALAGGPVPAAAPPTASAPASAPAPAAADATRTQVADLHTDLDALKRQIENLLAASAMETDRERKKELSAQIKSLLDRAEETETLIETLESHDIVESLPSSTPRMSSTLSSLYYAAAQGATQHTTTTTAMAMMGQPRSLLGYWQSDADAPVCGSCGRRFNLFVRRHHCRRCGYIFCDACTGKRIALPPVDPVDVVGGSVSSVSGGELDPVTPSLPIDIGRPRSLAAASGTASSPGRAVPFSSSSPSPSPSLLLSSSGERGAAVGSLLSAMAANRPSSSVVAASGDNPSALAAPTATPTTTSRNGGTVGIGPAGSGETVGRVCDACYVVMTTTEASGGSGAAARRPTTRSMTATATATATAGASSSGGVSSRGPRDRRSVMAECPVCQRDLGGLTDAETERHVAGCLESVARSFSPPKGDGVGGGASGAGGASGGADDTGGRSSGASGRAVVKGNRYLVQVLDHDMEDTECTICFEEFVKGQRIARLNCLCVFHEACIKEWFTNRTYGKRMCPVHYQYTD